MENLPVQSTSKLFSLSRFLPSALVAYSLVIFLVSLGDAIMSYMAPVFISDHLSKPSLMGIVMASSSLAAIIFDTVFGEKFRGQNYKFYLWWTFIFAAAFPLAFLILPPIIPFLVLSMIIWGIYYELIQFSNYHFIYSFMSPHEHASSWGTLSIFKSISYLLGPILAEYLIDKSVKIPFIGTLGIVAASLFAFMIFIYVFGKKGKSEPIPSMRHTVHGYQTLFILMSKIWPIWLFVFALVFVDATFWSIGTVLSEKLRTTHPLGGFLLVLYMLPSLFVSFLTNKASQPFGKKRLSFIVGILSGILLGIGGFVYNINIFLLSVLLSSVFTALATPAIQAVFEDYIVRLGPHGNDMIALDRSAVNLAYILGPALSVFLGSIIGDQKTFGLTGILLAVTSTIALIIVPRKIRLPQKELASS